MKRMVYIIIIISCFIINLISPPYTSLLDLIGIWFFNPYFITLVFLIPVSIYKIQNMLLDIDLVKIRFINNNKLYTHLIYNNLIDSLQIVVFTIITFLITYYFIKVILIAEIFTINTYNNTNGIIYRIIYFLLGLFFLLNIIDIMLIHLDVIKTSIIIMAIILISLFIHNNLGYYAILDYILNIFDFFIIYNKFKLYACLFIQLLIYFIFSYFILFRKGYCYEK